MDYAVGLVGWSAVAEKMSEPISVRLAERDTRDLAELAARLRLKKADVIRIAVRQLVEHIRRGGKLTIESDSPGGS